MIAVFCCEAVMAFRARTDPLFRNMVRCKRLQRKRLRESRLGSLEVDYRRRAGNNERRERNKRIEEMRWRMKSEGKKRARILG